MLLINVLAVIVLSVIVIVKRDTVWDLCKTFPAPAITVVGAIFLGLVY